MQREIHERMRRTVTKIAESAGASAELSIDKKTLITYNNPALVKRCCLPAKDSWRSEHGLDGCHDRLGGFSYFGEKVPSFFFFLGGMKKGQDPHTAFPHHTADFILKRAVSSWCPGFLQPGRRLLIGQLTILSDQPFHAHGRLPARPGLIVIPQEA